MRIYETIYIVRPDAQEEEINATIDQITSTITEGGGKVDKVDQWGKRTLAYRVRRYTEGYYVLVNYSVEVNVSLSKEVERRLKVSDLVIKHLTVRTDQELKRLEKLRAKREKRTSKKRSREPAVTPAEPETKAAAAASKPSATEGDSPAE